MGAARAGWLAGLLMAGCAQAPAPPPQAGFRDMGVPVYSNAVLDPAQLTGRWVQVAAFASQPGGCAPGVVEFGAPVTDAAGGRALPLRADLCLDGRRETLAGQAALPVPGRIVPQDQAGAISAPWWVLWADVDMRSLVIGTPSGQMGFILDRAGQLPADRLRAAREILEWNGYRTSSLALLR